MCDIVKCNQATGYAALCLHQARINWEGCGMNDNWCSQWWGYGAGRDPSELLSSSWILSVDVNFVHLLWFIASSLFSCLV